MKIPWNKNVFEMTHQLEYFHLLFFVTTDIVPEAKLCVRHHIRQVMKHILLGPQAAADICSQNSNGPNSEYSSFI